MIADLSFGGELARLSIAIEREQKELAQARKHQEHIRRLLEGRHKQQAQQKAKKCDIIVAVLEADPSRRFTTDEIRDRLAECGIKTEALAFRKYLAEMRRDLKIDGKPGTNRHQKSTWFARKVRRSESISSGLAVRSGARQRAAA